MHMVHSVAQTTDARMYHSKHAHHAYAHAAGAASGANYEVVPKGHSSNYMRTPPFANDLPEWRHSTMRLGIARWGVSVRTGGQPVAGRLRVRDAGCHMGPRTVALPAAEGHPMSKANTRVSLLPSADKRTCEARLACCLDPLGSPKYLSRQQGRHSRRTRGQLGV